MSYERNIEIVNEWLNSRLGSDRKEVELRQNIILEIASAVYQDRMQREYNQSEYAIFLGMSQAMISKIENGNINPTVEMLAKLATKLDFDFSLVFRPKGKGCKISLMPSVQGSKESMAKYSYDTSVIPGNREVKSYAIA